MIRTFTIWELLLTTAFLLVVGQQLLALLLARRRGLTENLSRVVTFSTLIGLALLYGALTLGWFRGGEAADPIDVLRSLPTANWGYLLLWVMLGLVVAYEIVSHVRAMRAGLTQNVSRLAALGVMLLLLGVLVGISGAKWNLYLDQLEATYSDSLQVER